MILCHIRHFIKVQSASCFPSISYVLEEEQSSGCIAISKASRLAFSGEASIKQPQGNSPWGGNRFDRLVHYSSSLRLQTPAGQGPPISRRKPMIQWVYEGAQRASTVEKVIIATDDERIIEASEKFGCQAVMTSPTQPSGTDRIAEALGDGKPEVVVNLQGDEPRIDPAAIDQLVGLFHETNPPRMATLCHPLSREEAQDPRK